MHMWTDARYRAALLLAACLLLPACASAADPARAAGDSAPAPAAPPVAAVDATARGRQLTQWFFTGALDSLRAAFNAQMTQQFSSRDLEIFYRQVLEQTGTQTEIIEENATQRDSFQIYSRFANYEKANGTLEVRFVLDPRARVAGFFVRPPERALPSKYLEYVTKTPLRLPFHGTWFTLWGGRLLRDNRHAIARDQRFAYDFFMLGASGTHTGDGTANAMYLCFGQPVVAPGPGTVAAAADTVPDNVPGTTNARAPLGNFVILDHGNGEYSVLAHFQHGSLKVRKGQKVKSGDVLGACGNSGNSTEPHVHYHLQDTATPFKADGLPAQFLAFTADGKPVERGEPHQGQTIVVP
jgi:murein DD-endopeptidase MepM/ murein hydrolase activator NlpD